MKLPKVAEFLFSLGISTEKSLEIANKGYKIKDLKQLEDSELRKLGFYNEHILTLRSKGRPPVDAKIINELLYESRFTCAVCRDSSKPIILHHIIPWEVSHSNAKENLIILCLEHHSEAHTKRDLSLNLNIERLKNFKNEWVKDAKNLGSKEISEIIDLSENACWDYFNLNRVFEIQSKLSISIDRNTLFDYLYKNSYIDKNGYLMPEEKWPLVSKKRNYWLDFSNGIYINQYLTEIFMKIINARPFRILNYIWERKYVKILVKSGDLVYVQGAFYFANTNIEDGNRVGYRKANNVKLEFTFHDYYCTSSSAKCIHLSGRKVISFFGIVRYLNISEGKTVIRCSVLAIGSYFHNKFSNTSFLYNIDNYADRTYQEIEEEVDEDDFHFDFEDDI